MNLKGFLLKLYLDYSGEDKTKGLQKVFNIWSYYSDRHIYIYIFYQKKKSTRGGIFGMFPFQSIGYNHSHQLILNCYLFHQVNLCAYLQISPISYFSLFAYPTGIYLLEMDKLTTQPAIYILKINNRNTRLECEKRHWRRCGVFIVNFEYISHLPLV